MRIRVSNSWTAYSLSLLMSLLHLVLNFQPFSGAGALLDRECKYAL